MLEDQFFFSAPEHLTLQDLKNWLLEKWTVEEQEPVEIERVFFDTFDWRLFNSGRALEISVHKPGYLLTLRELGTGKILVQTASRSIPHLAGDFVAPGLQALFKEALGARALFAKLSISGTTKELRVVDSQHKTLMRIELRQDRAIVPHSTRFLVCPIPSIWYR